MSVVRTVLGDVAPWRLGVCDAHDQLFLSSPRLPGEEVLAGLPGRLAEVFVEELTAGIGGPGRAGEGGRWVSPA